MNNTEKIGFICRFLDENGIGYEKYEHEQVSSIEECRKIEKAVGGEICKNLLLRNTPGTAYFLLSMKGEKPFVTKEVSKKLGSSRLSFVSEEEMLRLTDTSHGSLGIMSLLFDEEKKIVFAIDRDLLSNEFFCFHAGINTCTLKIRTDELFSKLLPALGREATIINI